MVARVHVEFVAGLVSCTYFYFEVICDKSTGWGGGGGEVEFGNFCGGGAVQDTDGDAVDEVDVNICMGLRNGESIRTAR